MRRLKRIKTKNTAATAAVVLLLTACSAAGPRPPVCLPPQPEPLRAPAHVGRPYDVAPAQSLLTILAFRGGALGKAGHNHVIASHGVTGTIYVPEDPSSSTFELHIPVDSLAVDEPDLRAREGAEFATEVPESAREGTRRNMLSEALLNSAQFAEITLKGPVAGGLPAVPAGQPVVAVEVPVEITVRGRPHTVVVPVTCNLDSNQVEVSGELPLRQSELGLTPFSALLGALQVEDELRVRFHFIAPRAGVRN